MVPTNSMSNDVRIIPIILLNIRPVSGNHCCMIESLNLYRASGQKAEDVEYLMGDLQMKGMIKEIGSKRWIRMPQERKLTIKRQRNSRSSRTSMELSMDEGDKRRHGKPLLNYHRIYALVMTQCLKSNRTHAS